MIVLVHGWGFDPALWDDVEAVLNAHDALPPRWRVDLGLFGPAHMDLPAAKAITLAVGHSYGVLWLLARTPLTVPLLAINGFARLCNGGGQREGIPPRLLERMRDRLSNNPQGTLDAFRARCGGLPAPRPGLPRALAEGLTALREGDLRPRLAQRRAQAPQALFALGGGEDPIVHPALTVEAFGADPTQGLIADGAHLLPLTHPQAVAAAILRAVGQP